MRDLTSVEKSWRDKYQWLLSCGYQLRPRLRPGWVPSWISDPMSNPMGYYRREDYLSGPMAAIDATRIEDGVEVMLKYIPLDEQAYASGTETEIACHVSLPALQDDPDNHCVQVFEVLRNSDDSSFEILVMPLLRPFDSPRFETVGEGVDFFRQAFKGLQFLHRHRIAHRDCTGPNIMMDCQLFPDGWHPLEPNWNRAYKGPSKQVYTRTQKPPRYLWIDFGLSAHFKDPNNPPAFFPAHGTDKSAPEFSRGIHNCGAYDPFLTDIYYLGNLVNMYFLQGSEFTPGISGFEFMKPLVEDMVRDDPRDRPDINECVSRLNAIILSLPTWKLRSQVTYTTDNIFGFIWRLLPYLLRLFTYIFLNISPIPTQTAT